MEKSARHSDYESISWNFGNHKRHPLFSLPVPFSAGFLTCPRASEPAASPSLSKGAQVDLDIDKLAFGGKALGRVDGFVVFVDHALPGQRLRVRITRKKSRFAEATVVQLLAQSPAYTPPFCPHFGVCGGCQWQDLAYEEQLRWKRVHVQECLQHLAGLTPGAILPTVASPHQRYYRNKMEFTFAPRPWLPAGDLAAGNRRLAAPAPWGCMSGTPPTGSLIWSSAFSNPPSPRPSSGRCAAGAAQSGLPAYNPRTHRGFWRFLVLREGKRTAQTLVHLITTDQGDPAAVEALAAHLLARFPAITTLVHSRSRNKAQVASGESSRILWGPGYIEEQLGDLRLRISAHSFLQTNTAAAEGLYERHQPAGRVHRRGDRLGPLLRRRQHRPALWPRGCAGWWDLNWSRTP